MSLLGAKWRCRPISSVSALSLKAHIAGDRCPVRLVQIPTCRATLRLPLRQTNRAEPDGRAVCQAEFLSTLAWPLDARVKSEFDPNPARLAHDEMDLRPFARQLRGEFHNNAGPAGNAFIQGIQTSSIGDCEG
jgi:hypothetical protein